MTEREASRRAGLSLDAIRNVRIGRSKAPKAETLNALARVLGVTLQELATGDVTRPAAPTVSVPEEHPAFGRPVTWAVPTERVPDIDPSALKAYAAPREVPDSIVPGDRLFVDTSVKTLEGFGFFILDIAGGHVAAHIRPVLSTRERVSVCMSGSAREEVDPAGLLVVGRVVGRWTRV